MSKKRIVWPAAALFAMMGACMVPPPATPARCGDGVLDEIAGEECDDGELDTASCNDNCTVSRCGDGQINPAAGEECDDGNAESGDGCNASCLGEPCSDGVQEPGCDAFLCGDRNLDPEEQCDEGGADTATCNQDCTVVECGDEYVNQAAREDCDTGGESLACDSDCTFVRCGDLVANAAAGEECDEGGADTATCDQDCTVVVCGDEDVNQAAGEECDAGGESSTCDSDCTPVMCGDGLVNAAAGEECDDTNLDDSDECLRSCKHASCDDGIQNRDEVDVDCGGPCVECWSETGNQLAAGRDHTCALTLSRAGAVRCWGLGKDGRLGYGNQHNVGDDEIAATAGDVDVGGQAQQLAAGGSHTCALLDTGAVRCWGKGSYGRLGYGDENDIGDAPGEIVAAGDVIVGGHVSQIVLGEEHTCALLDTGAVRCWGKNDYRQLGYEILENIGDELDETPATAGDVNVGGRVVQLAAGGYHTCALLDTGAVQCWGRNDRGQLGRGDPDETPGGVGDVDVGGVVVQLAAGGHHTCALLDTGAVRCWGRNDEYQLGYGHTEDIGDEPDETPAAAGDVNMGGSVVQLAAGRHHTCARLVTGAVRCWGTGAGGQLGHGTPDKLDIGIPALAGDVPFRSSGT